MKRNKYFINLINQRLNFRTFTTVMAFTAKEACKAALEKFKTEGYDMIESITRIA